MSRVGRKTGVVLSWLLGILVVRIGLAWADSYEYSAASETRYLAVAVLALFVAIGGTFKSLRRRR